jgi:uncharacterized membrane protein
MSMPQPKFHYVEPPSWFFYRKIQPLVVLIICIVGLYGILLASSLSRLLSDRQLRRTMGQNALIHADGYLWHQSMESLIRGYQGVPERR